MHIIHTEFINVYNEFAHYLNIDELIIDSPNFDTLLLQLNMSNNEIVNYILDRLQIYNELYPKSSIDDMDEAIYLHVKYLLQFIYKLGYQTLPFDVLSYLLRCNFVKHKVMVDIYNQVNSFNPEIYFIVEYFAYKESLHEQNEQELVDMMTDFNIIEENSLNQYHSSKNYTPSTHLFMNHAIVHNLYNCILWMKEEGFDVHNFDYYITLAKHNYLDSLSLLLETNHEMLTNLDLIRQIEYTIREKYINEFDENPDLYILDESKYKRTVCIENNITKHKHYKYEFCCNCDDKCYGCVCLKILSTLENIVLNKMHIFDNTFSKNQWYH